MTSVFSTGPHRSHQIHTLLTGAILIFSAAAIPPASAQTTVVVQNDFEDGTLQGWIPRGGSVVLTNTTEAAHGGTHSLKSTGRTAGFNGPSLNVLPLLTKGATYQVTAWVRLVAGTDPTQIKITVQRTPSGGSNQFDSVASSSATGVTDSAWVQLTGLYSYAGDVTGLLLYIESSSNTASYDVDDFSITLVAPAAGPPANTTGLTSTFEDNTSGGWSPRIGDETLAVTNADAHGGTYSLLTSGRQHAFDGPAYNVTNVMFNGSRYNISLWVKLAPGEAPSQLRLSLQRDVGSTTTFHTVIGNTNVTAASWVQLATTYDLALANSTLTLYVESNAGTASFYIDDVQIAYVPPPQIQPSLPSLSQTLAPYFAIGAAVNTTTISGVHADLLTKHFNSITSENDMKWDATEPTEGAFRFTNADAEVSFAKANRMQIRGHNFVWHQQIPAWVFTDPGTGATMLPTPANKALLLQRLKNHITGVGGHFGSDIYAWDVVNEAIDPNQSDCLRRSTWYTITGKDFIDVAFQTARQVLPNAKLYYNDYSTTDAPKLACIYNLVSDLKSRGIPIDGVGHQMHINLNYPGVPAVLNAITMLAGLGIDQQITEMDISVGTGYTFYANIPPSVLNTQGSQYGAYFDLYRQLRGLISSVTTWGMADDHTWLDSGSIVDAPLFFDQGLQAKPAYYAVLAMTNAVANPKNTTVTQNQIQLDGSASTSFDGKPLQYQWTQTTGTLTAAIAGSNSSTPLVQLVSGPGTYRFTLTVTDSIGVTATDTIGISYVGR